MNKARRTVLHEAYSELDAIMNKLDSISGELNSLKDKCDSILEDVKFTKDEEEDAKDNLPDSFIGTDRYNDMESAIDSMDRATDTLEGVLDDFNEALSFLKNISGHIGETMVEINNATE